MFLKLVMKFVFAAIVLYAAIYPVLNFSESELKSKPTIATKQQNVVVADRTPLPDFSTYVDVKQKKAAFFSYLAPHVKQINSELAQQRQFILSLEQLPTQAKEAKKLIKIAKKFHLEEDLEFSEMKRLLLLRVDELPIELVLMQAANESAWGTSRFALEANNLFGQWCFKKGCGIVPSGRPAGKKYEVRKFKHPVDSIRSYYNNLNTGYAYKELRKIRLNLRKNNKKLDPNVIADGLLSYSTRREAYINELKAMIRINKKYIKVN